MRRTAQLLSIFGLAVLCADIAIQVGWLGGIQPTHLLAALPFALTLAAIQSSGKRWLAFLAITVNALWAVLGILVVIGIAFLIARGSYSLPFSPVLVVVVALVWSVVPGLVGARALLHLSKQAARVEA